MEHISALDEPYRFHGLPLTPAGIQELILELFAGKTIERQVIVDAVRDAHVSRGGVESRAADFPRSVKKALANLKSAGVATNPQYGYWKINSRDGDEQIFLPAIAQTQDDIADDLLELEPDADIVLGTGPSAVYVYYFDGYRENAIQSRLNRWACKVGRTDRDPLGRVTSQAATALPEFPHIAVILRTSEPSAWESAIHDVLTIRGQSIDNAPGKEWFNTSPQEILDIIRFIQPGLFPESGRE